MGGVAMSVINQMLQDLENRHSATGADVSMSAHIKAVPNRTRIHPAAWIILLLGLTVVAGVIVWRIWPVPKVADVVHPAGAIAGAPVTQAAPSRHKQHPLSPTPAPARTQASRTDLKPPPQTEAAQQRSAAKKLQPEQHGPVPEQLTIVPPMAVARSNLDQQVLIVGAAPSRPGVDSGTPNPALPAQPLPASASQAGLGQSEVAGTREVTKQIKALTPQQRAEIEYAKAVSLLQQGRAAEASELLGNVLQLDPGNTAARQTLVGLLVAGKRYGEAERSLQDGLKLNPGQTGLAMILARLQVEQGDTRRGLNTLLQSVPYAAELPDYQAFLAALLQREGRHKEAIEHYLQALRKVPGSGVWLMGLGISLQAENRLAEAQEAFIRAKASNTLSPDLQAFVEQQLKRSKQQ